jgi:hypothetical protein
MLFQAASPAPPRFPVYFLRPFTSFFNDDDPRGAIINTVTLWYWFPSITLYNLVLEGLFLHRK